MKGCLDRTIAAQYLSRQSPYDIGVGYLIVDCVGKGKMLSESWETLRSSRIGQVTTWFYNAAARRKKKPKRWDLMWKVVRY
jgi:hypothetical protein